MRKWFFVILFLLGCQESSEYSLNLETDTASGVVGGVPVPFENPLTSQALKIQVVYETVTTKTPKGTRIQEKFAICTGAAISRRIILTAAHCIKKNGQSYRVSIPVIGGEFVNFYADYYTIHGGYETKGVDLALLRMPSDLPKEVTILKLPEQGKPFDLKVIGAAGYGDTSGRDSHVTDGGILRAATLQVVNYKPNAPTFVVDQTKGRGICLGDSGGPALLNIDNETYLVGVVESVLYKDGAPDKCKDRGQYTNIYPYLTWLEKASAELLAK